MMRTTLVAELAAEFLGTMILILIGCGVVAMTVLFGNGDASEIIFGGYSNITWAWGIAVAMGVFVAARTSGGHLNPAVTLSFAVFRGFPWSKVLPYSLAQIAGAFAGAALVFLNYRPAFERFDPAFEKTAGVFATFPAFPTQPFAGFFDQVLGTAILLFLICAIIEERNIPIGNLAPLAIGLIVVGIGMSFGALHGYAINPARDLGPRLLTVVAGFRNNGLTDGSGIFWVPVVAPLLGGILGTAAYEFGVRRFLPEA